MSALLGWVSGGHFLGGLGPQDLGKALLDVQVRAVPCTRRQGWLSGGLCSLACSFVFDRTLPPGAVEV
jgi:hypothetical protein